MSGRIYLDNAASTPLDPEVFDAMRPFYQEVFGNASSLHLDGIRARASLDRSREVLAACLEVQPDEVVFTASGTESNNLAIKGAAFANRHRGNHIIVSSIEHDCILNTCRWLETQGFRISYLDPGEEGIIDPQEIRDRLLPSTILVSVMHANNEIGTIQPLQEIGDILKEREVLFHTDACQSFGKIPVDMNEMSLSMITINAHKIHGPKGVGALVVRKGIELEPWLHGGGQERGLRSSTENIPGVAGFAKAAEIACRELKEESRRLLELRNIMVLWLMENVEGVYFNGSLDRRIPHNLNFSVSGLEGEAVRLMLLLDEAGISVSTGSACSSNAGDHHASHVLQAIGRNPFEARGAIRVSMGRFTTREEINRFLSAFSTSVKQLHSIFS